MPTTQEPLLEYFAFESLPSEALKSVAQPFAFLATQITHTIPAGPHRDATLNHLLDARNCALQAAATPGE